MYTFCFAIDETLEASEITVLLKRLGDLNLSLPALMAFGSLQFIKLYNLKDDQALKGHSTGAPMCPRGRTGAIAGALMHQD